MTRHASESEEREPKPTAVMRRDDLLELVNASAAVQTSSNVLPRALMGRRDKRASSETSPLEEDVDLGSGVSPTVVLMIIGVLLAMFVAIVATGR